MRRVLVAMHALAGLGCVSYQEPLGSFGLVSTAPQTRAFRTLGPVEATACSWTQTPDYGAITDAALAKRPPANVLLDAKLFRSPRCITATGTAAVLE